MKIRNIIFWGHLIVGMTVGIFILIMATTGAMLAFRPQIIAFAEQGMKNTAEISSKDPSQARVLMKKIESWHRWFGVDGPLKPIAHNIKTVCNLAFLFMVLSGFYLWWPRKIIRFKSGLSGKAQDWNRHNTIGFWCAPFLIIISLTGVIMSFQKPLPKPQAKIEMANVEMAKPAPLSAQDPERKFRKLVRSIHTGEAGGLIGQIFAFLAACGAIILVWTGFGMARRRFFAASIKLNK